MGHKRVCLDYRESFNLDVSYYSNEIFLCAKCGKEMTVLPHRFRPPKKTDESGWELVEFLIINGFPFQHIYQKDSDGYFKKSMDNYVAYPKNIRDAKEFILKYKDQAKKGK